MILHYTSAQTAHPTWCVDTHDADRGDRDVEHRAIPAVLALKGTDTVATVNAARYDEYDRDGDVVDLALTVDLDLRDELCPLPGGENHAFTRMSLEAAEDLVQALQSAMALLRAEQARIDGGQA